LVTTFEPMSPVPPMTTIFIDLPSFFQWRPRHLRLATRLGSKFDAGRADDAGARGRRGLRGDIEQARLAATGIARNDQRSAVGAGPKGRTPDVVQGRVAPDKTTGVAAIALPFIVIRNRGVEHWRYAWFSGRYA